MEWEYDICENDNLYTVKDKKNGKCFLTVK